MPTAAQIQARKKQLIREDDRIQAKIDELQRSGRKVPDMELLQLAQRQGEINLELMRLMSGHSY